MALPDVADGRRLDGAQLAIDTTLVRPPQRRQPNESHRGGRWCCTGELANGKKERTLTGGPSSTRQVGRSCC